jgi:hypothetical protein
MGGCDHCIFALFRRKDVRNIVIGAITGLIITIVVGFNLYGWHTAGNANEIANSSMKRAAMCVAEFVKAPDYEKRIKELGGMNQFEYAAYIEKGGWGKPSGEEVARPFHAACAEAVTILVKK